MVEHSMIDALPPAQYEVMTPTEIGLEAAVIASLIIDWGQTRDLAKQDIKVVRTYDTGWEVTKLCKDNTETNPLLGRFPSLASVNRYFISALILQPIILRMMSHKWRMRFLTGTLAIQLVMVNHNRQIGLKVRF
jgi:hypothetical protein